jgi:hypothetical protein
MWPTCRLKLDLLETIGLQPSDGKGPLPLLWAGSRAASLKLTVSELNIRDMAQVADIYKHGVPWVWGEGSPNVHDAKMCCGFCHTVVRFSNTRQNSSSLS